MTSNQTVFAQGLSLRRVSPLLPDLAALFASHHRDCSAGTAPESNHMQGPQDLAQPATRFFVLSWTDVTGRGRADSHMTGGALAAQNTTGDRIGTTDTPETGTAIAMGAWKPVSPDSGAASHHGELKSMHVLMPYRGQGHSGLILRHLIADAKAAGITRLSLETGVEPVFAAARGLYLRAGFVECEPFGTYRIDPNSMFLTRTL